MMSATMPSFAEMFSALWGCKPFPWQDMLAERVAAGRWPQFIDLPTASGKTACIDIAIFALARQADLPLEQRTAPRRLWFVVDRRIVVDQAFERAQAIATKLCQASDGPLRLVADRLRSLSGTDRPLAVARLRGGVFRDDGWARLPSQPTVIASTVDQVGSRLLFRGYGRSHLTASIFAGLTANDSLVLLDEAHCSKPFLRTLEAIARFRGEPWAEAPLRTPFAVTALTATPPSGLDEQAVFPGIERDRAFDDDRLRQRMQASKLAELIVVKERKRGQDDPLVSELVAAARKHIATAKRVAVMVNRVRTAVEVARVLSKQAGQECDVVLLTGRLREIDRDEILGRWMSFLSANDPNDPERPLVVVSTQCLEVGADVSFDALVTEAASLDALRQRFGRLDRMGRAGTSSATVVVRSEDANPDRAEPDPIYGEALSRTWDLLANKARREGESRIVDFGVSALRELLSDVDDWAPHLAPSEDAPVLLPAHLDLFCQTAPIPHPDPGVASYLHGVGRSAPEVHVVWRADLDDRNISSWIDTVAMCRPASGEMLQAPLWRVRAWLSERNTEGVDADVEGIASTGDENEAEGVDEAKHDEVDSEPRRARPFLLWRGRRSRVAQSVKEIAPGDVVVVPASYGTGDLLARAEVGNRSEVGESQFDLWERAVEQAGWPPAVRLHRGVLAPWIAQESVKRLLEVAEAAFYDTADLEDAIDTVLAVESDEGVESKDFELWRQRLKKAKDGRVERHPAGGVVLFARPVPRTSAEPDLFADDDDLTSAAASDQSLEDHSSLVRDTVAKLADRCLPASIRPAVLEAAYWHDVGKVDPRFQVLLHQGDELAAAGALEPLAKSRWLPMTARHRRALGDACGLPDSFRHEMLSVQIAERQAHRLLDSELEDLFLHLVASHHGHARPLAPVCIDPQAPSISGRLGNVNFEISAEDRQGWIAHRIDSGLADRFWRLTRRYGWWGLAYVEAIVRLGDWYASGLRKSGSSASREVGG